MEQTRPPLQPTVQVLALLVGLMAVVVIISWFAAGGQRTGPLIGVISMKFNAAVSFLLCSLAVGWVRPHSHDPGRRSARSGVRLGAAGMVMLVSALTLAEYVSGVSFGIDEIIVEDPNAGPGTIPGRMSVITSLCFLLLGTGLILNQARPERFVWFSTCCTVGLALGMLAVVGYIYGVRFLYQPIPATAIAPHAGVAFVLLFGAMLLSRPDRGLVALALRKDEIGLITRRVVPMLIVVPASLGWAALQGFKSDWYGAPGLMASYVASTMLVFMALTISTVRRAVELSDRLRHNEYVYSTVMENSLDAFVVMNAQGVIVEWNPQAQLTFGWTRDEALGATVESLIVPADMRERHRHGLQQFLSTGVGPVIGRRITLEGTDKAGTSRPVELMIIPVREHGGEWMFYGFMRDLTEQRATEYQLRQAQKMEAVGQLTGGVAHDFNNLLTVIIGNLDLAAQATDFASVRNRASAAREAAERGASLVAQLLAFSRRQPLKPASTDLWNTVTGMHDILHRTLGEDVDIRTFGADDLWPVIADSGQLENALLNLAVNARDAMPAGGVLTIEVANAHLDSDYASRHDEVSPGDYVKLTVTDTGRGMAPHVAEKAFDPFFTTKDVGQGSGLGLSMVYGFAKQSNGHVKIYSEVDHGTTVHLYLPRAQEAPRDPTRSEPQRSTRDARGERILVLEDDPAVRAFVVSVLESFGYQAVTARSGPEALAYLTAGEPIDLLFTDVVLPGGQTGREVAEAAVELRPHLKVLYTSGYTRNSIIHQGRLDADVTFIAKPYRGAELAQRIRDVLDP